MSASINPDIVTDGLVLCLDAGNPASYPGSGTLWTDLSGNGNNGILTNGPIYSTSNVGIFKSDAVDSYIQIGATYSDFQFSNYWTYCGFVYCNFSITSNSTIAAFLGKGNTNASNGLTISFRGGSYNGLYCRLTGTTINATPNIPNTDIYGNNDISSKVSNSWSYISLTKSNYSYSLYYNGNLLTNLIDSYNRDINNNTNNFRFIIGDSNTSAASNVWLGSQMIYQKTLSNIEILQNYNAIKGRYGL